VHVHEFGHNVGASHTSGGLMNPSRIAGNENFYADSENGAYTGAKDIYNYMSTSGSAETNQYGGGPLRDPAQIPFAIDDTVNTPAGTAVTISPLANDQTSVRFGAVNALGLVEAGSVYPRTAGTVIVEGRSLRFTPAPGFIGQAWFTYTLSGSVGNGGRGWLHSADVSVNVGGSSSSPDLNPALTLRDDRVTNDFAAPVRINPLLNDEAAGRLWAGDVEVRSSAGQIAAAAYSERAFQLVSAQVVTGNGTVVLETRPMVRDAGASAANGGYLVYTPGATEPDQVVISYVARDANGATATGRIEINRTATVALSANAVRVSAASGRVVTLTATRNAVASVAADETVAFRVTGDGALTGASPEVGVAGAAIFDAASGTGTVVIPAGAVAVSWFLVPANLTDNAAARTVTVRLTEAESLELATAAAVTISVTTLETPLLETFDSFTAINAGTAWSTVVSGNLARWEVASGSTTVSDTGPSGGYPGNTGKYLYVTANGRIRPSTATLVSPTYDLAGFVSAEFTFAYHMLGVDVGNLRLDVFANGVWNADVVTIAGQQSVDGLDWKTRTVNLAAYRAADFRLRFRYNILASGLRGEAAIDLLSIRGTPGGATTGPTVLSGARIRGLQTGDPLYLAVAAESFPAPVFQWKRNGAPIAGATSPVYAVNAVTAGDGGVYTVDITNGSTTTTARVGLVSVGATASKTGYAGLAGDDPDGDGVVNLIEAALGSDPASADSTARTEAVVDAGGVLSLSFMRAYPDFTYTVEASSDLAGWTVLAVNPGVAGQSVTVTDVQPEGATRRFLRLRVSRP
jgi:MAM domain, meprin/A5/mu/Bacterial Ig domain